MKGIFNYFKTLRLKREAKREGVPFEEKQWYNYRAMMDKEHAKDCPHIEIFDENGKYIDCPGVGGEVVYNYKGRRYKYKVVGFKNDSRNSDWLYATDYINPIIQYLGKSVTIFLAILSIICQKYCN